jgi:hypothetical protein
VTASTLVSVSRARTTVQPNVVPAGRPLAYNGQRTLLLLDDELGRAFGQLAAISHWT